MSPFFIASITRALAPADPEPERCHREPVGEVQVVGVPEGGYGVFGRVVGETALIDPVCGMVARDMVATLEHDGTTHGFCSLGCRRHFAGEPAEEAAR
ncbi:hypothetical protein [Actinoallomurus iriomotensis]|uniref:hypothetical protein n=1 Tax=Actinoallomurus iriomotensis TaxID=478107 RepID=UPI002552C7BD|nr:hypothetical protein [Actinoallomurus iriomotensis]